MLNNKKDEILLQGQEELQTGNKEKQHNNKESKILSNMKLKFINPSAGGNITKPKAENSTMMS